MGYNGTMTYNTDLYRKLSEEGYILLPEFNFVTSVDHPFPEDKMLDLEEKVKEKYADADIEIIPAGFDGNRQLNGVSVWIRPTISPPSVSQN